ncbi:MAG: hypothetical protein H6622_17815 [Halobacteriovoraceae bacterium]|nr:hypothetical protein [Halobacteriovoraceae bacterium]
MEKINPFSWNGYLGRMKYIITFFCIFFLSSILFFYMNQSFREEAKKEIDSITKEIFKNAEQKSNPKMSQTQVTASDIYPFLKLILLFLGTFYLFCCAYLKRVFDIFGFISFKLALISFFLLFIPLLGQVLLALMYFIPGKKTSSSELVDKLFEVLKIDIELLK